MSLKAITNDSIISKINQIKWTKFSTLSSRAFLPKIKIITELTNIIKNLHQSRAGSGNKLKAAILMLNKIHITRITLNQTLFLTKSTNKLPRAIGHHTLSTASFLS